MTTTAERSATAVRLLDVAEHLMARSGIQGVTTREIVEAAGQRNVSAVHYHFGSRQNLLLEVLRRRGAPVDEARGALRASFGVGPPLRSLVAALVVPYSALMESESGRSYLRIVGQLRGRFAAWRTESDAVTTGHMARIFDEIEAGLAAPPAVTQERIIAMMILLTGACAERARRIDDGGLEPLEHEAFVENLTAMCTAVLLA